MAERFYVNSELKPGPVLIQGAEAHHLAVVCRLRQGDSVCLFNGDGHQYPAHIASVSRREVALEVLAIESPMRELPFRLEVAAPLPRGDRAQFLLEKLTELGVAAFTPLRTTRSVVHPRESKLDKLQRYVIEASKQCGRNVLLEVRALAEWSAFCRAAELPPHRVLAHPETSPDLPCRRPRLAATRRGARFTFRETINVAANRGLLLGSPDPFLHTIVAVGPEGGFTEEEVALAAAADWHRLDLGPRILRVETAAIVLAVLFG